MPALPSWLVALPWAIPFLGLLRLARRTPSLAEVRPDTATPLSIIIPARNEEQDIQKSLASVLAQEGANLEVIVVNDHSEDRTGEIVDAIARHAGH